LKKNINREKFLKLSGAIILAGASGLWYKLISTEENLATNQIVALPFNPNKAISFYKEFIIMNKEEKTSVFSSKCTHLGCTINEVKDGVFICPCHGSTYDEYGNPLKGPAIKSLRRLEFEIENGQIIVKL
jgi:cytochrome b6-f complex iron-sulfur subunit